MNFFQSWQFTPYALPSLLAFFVSSGLAAFVWRRRPSPASMAFAALLVLIAIWSFGNTLEIAALTLPAKIFWNKFQYLGTSFIPVGVLLFGLRYSAQPSWWPSRRVLALLSILPLITVILTWTNELHGLVWRETSLVKEGPLIMLQVERGPWFWVYMAYVYAGILITAFLIALAAFRWPHLYRRQALMLLVAIVPSWATSALYLTGLLQVPIELTPLTFTITALVVAWGLFRFSLFSLVPVAREMVVESMSDGMLVLDVQGRVADMNQAARHIVGFPVAQAVGREATTLFADQPALAGFFQALTEKQVELGLGDKDRRRDYEAHLSPMADRSGQVTGWLAVFRDITARKEDERRYESLLADAQRQSLELALLDRVRTALARELNLTRVFHTVVEAVAESFGYTLVSLYVLEGETLILQHQIGYENAIRQIPVTLGVSGRVVQTRKAVLL